MINKSKSPNLIFPPFKKCLSIPVETARIPSIKIKSIYLGQKKHRFFEAKTAILVFASKKADSENSLKVYPANLPVNF